MTQTDFQKLFDERIEKLLETGRTKGVKYTVSAEDRLANFKSLLPRMTSLQVWEVFFSKHWSAIQYFLQTGENIGEDICDTHIHDCIMYLFLLEGIVKDQRLEKKHDNGQDVFCFKYRHPFKVSEYHTDAKAYCPTCKTEVLINYGPPNRQI